MKIIFATIIALLPFATLANNIPTTTPDGTQQDGGSAQPMFLCTPTAFNGGTACKPNGSSGTGIATVPTPASVTPTPCQGGTGSAVTTIGTTATIVCAASTSRSFVSITSGVGNGGVDASCTWDGSAPVVLTHRHLIVYANGQWDSSGMTVVPPGQITCIAPSSVAITATAVQVGAP